jgi:hypothetical protein
MPLGDFEREVLRSLATNRSQESFIAGATVIHQSADSPRSSEDIDIFHDASEQLIATAEADAAVLRNASYEVHINKTLPTFIRADVRRNGQRTKIEWVLDSAFRFFPAERDIELGWRLNFWDAATNKILALCARTKLRDMLDTLYLHEQHLHLGALAWAAGGKDPGLSPELVVILARRFAVYRNEDVREVKVNAPIDLKDLKIRWMDASQAALDLVAKLPPAELGCLYLNSAGHPVCPDPDSAEFSSLTRHYGSLRGALPRIVED